MAKKEKLTFLASELPKDAHCVAIVGNVNIGKSVIFNRLCKQHTKEGNYPGTSVDIAVGRISYADEERVLIDAPGTCTIFVQNEDEMVSRDIILSGGTNSILCVADAKNLKRSLALALQFTEYDLPMMLDINMMDEAMQRGITIDTGRLAEILGVPVNTSVAIEGQGMQHLQKLLPRAKTPKQSVQYPKEIEQALDLCAQILPADLLHRRALGILFLAGDKSARKHVREHLDADTVDALESIVQEASKKFSRPLDVALTEIYTRHAEGILAEVQTLSPTARMPFSEQLGAWSRNLTTGIPIAAIVALAMYMFVGKFGAEFLVGIFEGKVFGEWIIPMTERVCAHIPSAFIRDAIIDKKFGLISVGLSLVLGIVMPVLFTFFIFFSILEDSGYLPRLSVLLNRVLQKIGLNGKGIFPLIMGFSCITMAILTTRMLDTKKEKNIATLLLVMGIPCAPLLSVMLVILAKMNAMAYVAMFGILLLQIMIVGFIANKILPGFRSPLVLEIPPLRIPRMKSILVRAFVRTRLFLGEAIPFFLLATFVLFIFHRMGLLDLLRSAGRPVIENFVGLPGETIEVLISTLIRREAGAAMLKKFFDSGAFNHTQAVVALLIMTFLSPCANAIIVIVKERGVKVTVCILAFVMPYALLAGAIINRIFQALNVQFGG